MKKQGRKLVLAKETVRNLGHKALTRAEGAVDQIQEIERPIQGTLGATCYNTCNNSCGCSRICIRW